MTWYSFLWLFVFFRSRIKGLQLYFHYTVLCSTESWIFSKHVSLKTTQQILYITDVCTQLLVCNFWTFHWIMWPWRVCVYMCICVCVRVRVGDIRKFDKLPCLLANTVSPDSTFFGRDHSHITWQKQLCFIVCIIFCCYVVCLTCVETDITA